MPISILNWEAPYFQLFHKVLDYTHLKTFGCFCYATNTLPHIDKFTPRVIKCVFIGYSHCQKAYKLFEFVTTTIFVSRDVTFLKPNFLLKTLFFLYIYQDNSPLPQIPVIISTPTTISSPTLSPPYWIDRLSSALPQSPNFLPSQPKF